MTNSFIVSNATDQPVEITGVRPTCGCTFARAESNIVHPHKLGKVIFGYRASRQPGKVSKKILLSTPAEQIYLAFTADVKPVFELDKYNISLGDIVRTNTKTLTAEVVVTATGICTNLTADSFNYKSTNMQVDWSRDKTGRVLTIKLIIDTTRYTDAYLRDGFSFNILCGGNSKQYYVPITGTYK
jgi:hypothetical protein